MNARQHNEGRNRHEKRRAFIIERRRQKVATKVARSIGKAAEGLAKQWVNEEFEKAKREAAQ